MRTHNRVHLLVLSRSWSFDHWGDIHHEIPAERIQDDGPSSFMEHRIATFDAIPSDDAIAALIKDHDAMLARYDGHVERAATVLIDDVAWIALQKALPWRTPTGVYDSVYHRRCEIESLGARYPGFSPSAAFAPAADTPFGSIS